MSILISCQELSKNFGARPLFEGLSFGLFEGERTGLIGPNGTGKSTLLRILAGIDTPDSGGLAPRRGLRIGYLPQQDRIEDVPPGLTVRGRLDAALEDPAAATDAEELHRRQKKLDEARAKVAVLFKRWEELETRARGSLS